MEHQTATIPLYSAFLSYNHRDRAHAIRLQRRIENYRMPRRLVQKGIPSKLLPVFRDQSELSASPDLSDALRRALDRSEHLVVLCTPNAASSEWVGREISYFRSLNRGAVLGALFDGTSATALHPAMRVGKDGAKADPLAADFRRGGGGRLALLQLVAALANVGLDELVARDAQRRLVRLVIAAATLLLVAGIMAALIMAAMLQRAAADRERARGADAMSFQLKDLRGQLEDGLQLPALQTVNDGVRRFYSGQDPKTLPVAAQLQLAETEQTSAADDEKRGKLDDARKHAARALQITTRLLASHPDDPAMVFADAQSQYYVGLVDWRRGDAQSAAIRFNNYATLADRLVVLDPRNPAYRMEQGYAASNRGMVALLERRDTAHARTYFTGAQRAFVAASKRQPDDLDIRFEMADGEAWLSDLERLSGNYDAALAHRRAQRHILNDLVKIAPHKTRYRVDLIANAIGAARIAAERGRFDDALHQLDEARETANALALISPDTKALKLQIRAIELFKVQTWLAMPEQRRPARSSIARTLGNCDADTSRFADEELTAFCRLEEKSLTQASVQTATSARTIGNNDPTGRPLSRRWKIEI